MRRLSFFLSVSLAYSAVVGGLISTSSQSSKDNLLMIIGQKYALIKSRHFILASVWEFHNCNRVPFEI